jgi:hypothetical protein
MLRHLFKISQWRHPNSIVDMYFISNINGSEHTALLALGSQTLGNGPWCDILH